MLQRVWRCEDRQGFRDQGSKASSFGEEKERRDEARSGNVWRRGPAAPTAAGAHLRGSHPEPTVSELSLGSFRGGCYAWGASYPDTVKTI